MKKKRAVILIVAILAVIVLVAAFWPRRYSETFYPMGGIPFKVVAYGKNFVQFDRVMEAVENRVGQLEKIFSRHDKTSELSKLNADAAIVSFRPSAEMDRMLELSRKWYELSDGAFDPTVAPLLDLWEKAGKAGVVPGKGDIIERLAVVGLNKVKLEDDGMIKFERRGMQLDFGAIAKGFIVDEATRAAVLAGDRDGLLEAGGDAFAFLTDSSYVGIQDPADSSKLMGTIEVSKGAVVTSGDYERYVEIDGKKYPHIIDPRTGYPVNTGIVSVTIVGGMAVDADALATSIMVLGLEKGIALAKRVGYVKLIIVKRDGDDYVVHASKSLLPGIKWAPDWEKRVRTF